MKTLFLNNIQSIQKNLKLFLSKKASALLLITALIILLIVDQWIKQVALQSVTHSSSFLNFSLTLFLNYHWIFGLSLIKAGVASHLILLSCLFMAFYLYILILFYSSFNLYTKSYFTLIVAGLSSNLIDRLSHSYVVDFISYKLADFQIYFNSSDILQFVGTVALAVILIKNRKFIWRSKEGRNFFRVNFYREQMILISYFSFTVIGITTFLLFTSYFFMLKFIELNQQISPAQLSRFFFWYIMIAFLCYILPISLLVSFYFSQKIYGPIFAFIKYTKALTSKQNPPDLKLRNGDYLKQELEALAKQLKK